MAIAMVSRPVSGTRLWPIRLPAPSPDSLAGPGAFTPQRFSTHHAESQSSASRARHTGELSRVEYTTILQRLTPEAEALFCLMVEKHLNSTDKRWREFHTTIGGRGHTMIFAADSENIDVDSTALNDLLGYQ